MKYVDFVLNIIVLNDIMTTFAQTFVIFSDILEIFHRLKKAKVSEVPGKKRKKPFFSGFFPGKKPGLATLLDAKKLFFIGALSHLHGLDT